MKNTNLPSPVHRAGVFLSCIGAFVGGLIVWKVIGLLQVERSGVVFNCLFVLFERECASSMFERHLNGHCGRRVGGNMSVDG